MSKGIYPLSPYIEEKGREKERDGISISSPFLLGKPRRVKTILACFLFMGDSWKGMESVRSYSSSGPFMESPPRKDFELQT